MSYRGAFASKIRILDHKLSWVSNEFSKFLRARKRPPKNQNEYHQNLPTCDSLKVLHKKSTRCIDQLLGSGG